MRPACGLATQVVAAATLAALVVKSAALAPAWRLPLQVAIALACCVLVRPPIWWYAIDALFAPTPLVALRLAWPPWVYLVALLVAWSIFGRIDRSRVPLYLSNRVALCALDELIGDDAKVLDAGAGRALCSHG